MKISYNWLKDYADFRESPEALGVILTDCGLEVEALEKYETLKGGLQGVFVGEVKTCHPHPDADRLSVTTVDIGTGSLLPIVCGAPNVAAGQKVFVATVGTTLYTPKGELELKKVKIRGEFSEGMICAEDELGLGDDHEGIIELPPDAPVGIPAAQYLEVKTDHVFEIGLTPNRIDAASHFGVARDVVAVINHRQGKGALSLKKPSTEHFKVDNDDRHIPVIIDDPEACPRYSALTISGVRVGESPAWLKEKLMAIGHKPINNVVDVTNFVLQEMGHPLHAFDADKIEGQKVVVRKPEKDTLFVTLDQEERKLTGEDLMICSATTPMCIGGVMGGVHSGVTQNTTCVFLESAFFNPVSIRKTSKAHGLKTDASFRFERGADPSITLEALKRAALLIKEVAGGQISSEIVDEYPKRIEPAVVHLNLERAAVLIGKDIPRQEVIGILESLDIRVLDNQGDVLRLSIPTYRVDVTREADVIEELLRIYGYNNVELPERLYSSMVLTPRPDKEKLQNTISDMLTARGFNEIMNNSLTKGSYFEADGFDPRRSVQILNPLSQDLNVMRQTLLFGGLETIAYNQNRKVTDMKLYEFGNIYWKDPEKDATGNALAPFGEKMLLSLFITGQQQPETWRVKEAEVDFFDLKAAVHSVFTRMGVPEQMLQATDENLNPVFEYGLVYSLNNKEVTSLGKVGRKLLKNFDIKQDVYYATIEWESLMKHADRQQVLYAEISKFPEVRRDLALLIDRSVKFAQIEKLAFHTERKMLKAVRLFDVYQDERLGQHKKSYAVSFILLDERKTLTDKEIDKIMQKLAWNFEKELGAEIRK
ncbi:MAG: phenylalanine--tRNA ligase subunit beta [Bacteroides sp.]|jgi:phenylalanyl-tRNA synthetase beta chain|nr:phenylalanine--tRNA ligase subunit beta [Bacteroides sp.]